MTIDESRTPQVPPRIAPLPEGMARPLWSVMIPAYNCSSLLAETIASVLEQDPGESEMQIEVIDDFSTDADVGALVASVGKGRVSYYRQPKNVGSLRNFETCINRSKGLYVHILHGDDLSVPGYYTEIAKLFHEYPEAGAAFSDYLFIDEKGNKLWDNNKAKEPRGIIKDFLLKIGADQLIQPPSITVKRAVYEKLGSFCGVHCGEDWEMWARIAANYPVAFTPQLLARYRVHTGNVTFSVAKSGQNINDILQVIATIQTYLPPKDAARIAKMARRQFSIHYARAAHKVYHHTYDKASAWAQSKGALKLDVNKISLAEAVKMCLKILLNYKNNSPGLVKKWAFAAPPFFLRS